MTAGLQGVVGTVPIPTIGQSLRIRLSEHDKQAYHSRLVELSGEFLFIDVPLHDVDRTAAPTYPSFWVEFHAPDGAVCRFKATLLGTARMPAPAWKVARPKVSEVIRDQRREFVRVQVDLPVRLEYTADGGVKRVDLHTRDMSGGGMSLLLPKTVILRGGGMVDTKFTLSNGGFPVAVKCLVIRTGERNEFGIAPCSLQFVDIKEPVRQRIIQFVFWRQRQLT